MHTYVHAVSVAKFDPDSLTATEKKDKTETTSFYSTVRQTQKRKESSSRAATSLTRSGVWRGNFDL